MEVANLDAAANDRGEMDKAKGRNLIFFTKHHREIHAKTVSLGKLARHVSQCRRTGAIDSMGVPR